MWSLFKDKLVIAVMYFDAAAEEQHAILRWQWSHHTLAGAVIGQQHVLQLIPGVVAQGLYTYTLILFFPVNNTQIHLP